MDSTRDSRFSTIYKSDHPWLERRLRNGLRNREDAEDVAGETFTQLLCLPALEQLNEPRAMLVTIARRITWRLWRRRELEQAWLEMLRLQPEPLEPSAEERVQTLQALQALDTALDGLSAKARMAFLYSQLDGMTHVEIAARLKVSPTMVRKYIVQALHRCCEVFWGMTAWDARTRKAAIEWQVCLSSGQASDADRAAFDRWLAESPSHGAARQRLNAALNGTLHALRPGLLADGDALRRSLLGDGQRRQLGQLPGRSRRLGPAERGRHLARPGRGGLSGFEYLQEGVRAPAPAPRNFMLTLSHKF